MTLLFYKKSFSKFLLRGCSVFVILIIASCSTPKSRIQSDAVPPGSLRLSQVTAIANRDDIVQTRELYDVIRASGFNDSDIVDGCVVMARIYCCGGLTENTSAEKTNARMLYVPQGLNIALGDIVEVRVGRPPEKGDVGMLNVVTRLVQTHEASDGPCWWDPRDDHLWLRVLYCDWMPGEGWVKQGGISPAWFKPPTPDLAGK